ncbi:MAG TPA: ATP-binding protein [Petrotogaceae bacterium]|nr:GHKL domain-containing protein [Petrotogaceae bacterium]HNY36400.1 ATP-binding protein [Petrotogaceae bacterium]HOG33740.1 ATP-binding protein [Petrotogaceae bacterium]HPO26756.1 ATP-binding protein [Petrotogaceae bacterium]HPX15738.1 ATP-binding protein [Petrotogaceae bacterium]
MLYMTLAILLTFFAGIMLAVVYFRQMKAIDSYKKLKEELCRILDININNPSDDFLLHQTNLKYKSLAERYESERVRRKNLYSIMNNLEEGVIVVSIYQSDIIKVDFANDFSKRIFTIDDYVGRSIVEIVDNHSLIDLILKSYKLQSDEEEELLFYSPEKRFYKCKVKMMSIDDNGRIVLLSDITKEKNLENLRKEFLTTMSHELRTPLSVMNGYLETILMDNHLDKGLEKMLKIIEDETARLTRLVNDLLDLGRLEKSLTDNTNIKEINISNITKKVFEFFKLLSEGLDVSLTAEVANNLKIKGDEERIMQAVYNIVDNALKFTSMKEKGEKNVYVRLYKESSNVVLEIEDTGIGIPSKELEKIFDMFYRVDKSRTRQVSGFGLGLYIVKSILDKHNAGVYLESEENNGTLFRITFKGGIKDETL